MTAPAFDIENHSNPAEFAVAVTPSNTTDLPRTTRAIYVGVEGDLNVDFPDGSTVLFKNLAAGYPFPIRVNRVRSTGTDATDIVALF